MFKTTVHFLLISALIWLIPFAAAFAFYSREGTLNINFWLFKAIMALLLSACCWVGFNWFYKRNSLAGNWPLLIGIGAAAINVLLDMFTVVPLGNLTLGTYAMQIGLVYSLIVIFSVWIAQRGQQYG